MTEINAWYRVTRDCTFHRHSNEVKDLHAGERLQVVHLEDGSGYEGTHLHGVPFAVLDVWEDVKSGRKEWLEITNIDTLVADGTLEIAHD